MNFSFDLFPFIPTLLKICVLGSLAWFFDNI